MGTTSIRASFGSYRKFNLSERVATHAMVATQWSADGQWWWDGQEWHPAAQMRRQTLSSEPAPSPSLLTFGALACLGLALSSYLVLLSPFAIMAPVTSIISIAVGRAARHTLPKTAKRDRAIAMVGMVVAAIPLAVVIVGIIVLQLVLGYMIVTGKHSIP